MSKRDFAVVVSAVFWTACHPPERSDELVRQPSTSATITTSNPRIERGEVLSSMLGCRYCHMGMGANGPDLARPFAGGFEVQEKFGTWRAPNITQHEQRGIGAWSDEQIAAAIREGVRPEGTHLYPIMPYLNYNRMTDDDVQSLVAYLRTVPAIDTQVAPNDLELPQPIAHAPANAPDPTSDPVKHGEYLVTIMNCSMCHTPSGKDNLPDVSKQFAGGVAIEIPMLGTGELYASNITSDPTTGIGTWSQADLERAVRVPGVGGARVQMYLTGWNHMTDGDLAAIAAYIKTIPPIVNEVPRSTFIVTDRGSNRPITARR